MTNDIEFKECYQEGYGRHRRVAPDYSRCCAAVNGVGVWNVESQCTRKNGNGPHGAYCKQHDPAAIAARQAERTNKFMAERDVIMKHAQFKEDCMVAVRKIAAGADDPRGMCQGIIDELERKK